MSAPKPLVALIAGLALLIAGCGVGQRTGGKAARQESGAVAAATATPGAAEISPEESQATVRIHRLRLAAGGEKGGDRLRVMVASSTPQLRVTLSGNIDQEEHAVTVCSVTDETSVPPSTRCVLPVADRPVDLPAAPDVKGAEIALAGRATLVDLQEIAITYTPTDRHVRILLPNLEPMGDDPACLARGCPAFQVTPPRAGQLSAQVSWAQPGGGLLDIRTALRPPTNAASPTPPVYRVLSSSTSSSNAGPGSVSISATLVEEMDSLLAFTNNGRVPLITPVLDATWP